MENMLRCITWYCSEQLYNVIDLGAMNVNGSYRSLFPAHINYVGIDLEPGPGVDIVLKDAYKLPVEDSSADLVMSGQMLEHCGQFWRLFSEIARVLKPEGLAFMIAPSAGPVHRYPVDCYRFHPDAYQALADWSGLKLVHSWTDARGPWQDSVGVFQKNGDLQTIKEPRAMKIEHNYRQEPSPDPAVEVQVGERHYLDVLRDLHALIRPGAYLEIGARKGASLRLSEAFSIAIDPDPHPELDASGPNIKLYRCTSDDFFFFYGASVIPHPVNLAFIDGMHLAEYVYRDFMNVEQVMDPDGVIVVDDILPNHPLQATRRRQSQVWMGDVWRFAEFLEQKRPDLRLTWFDAKPSGLLVISNLNPKCRVLLDDYNMDMRQLADGVDTPVPLHILKRERAVSATFPNLRLAVGK